MKKCEGEIVQYQVIAEIKKTEKGRVSIVSAEGYPFPAVLKEVRRAERTVFDMLAGVKSEHIPQIYCVEETEEGLLVLEEYVEGELLSTYLREKKLTEAECLRIAEELCEALETLHGHTPVIIHRDIKPSNVVIGKNGVVKLIDFDSSRLYKEEMEEDTRILGTERFAPPEQYGFSQTDCRSDIYSLGVVFGMFPEFSSKTKGKQWKRMVEKCTAFAPESRFQTVEEVKHSLKKTMRTGTLRAAVIGAAVVVLLFGAGSAVMISGRKPQDAAQEPTSAVTFTPGITEEPTATQAPQETPEPTVIQSAEEEQRNKETAPEWRDVETDPESYVRLKEQIRERHWVVLYCFKDRILHRDFLYQCKELEQEPIEFKGLRLYSHRENTEVWIEEQYVSIVDHVIQIRSDYMQGLKEGYYSLKACMYRKDTDQDMESSVVLYVAEKDAFREPEFCLQNTTFTFYGGETETLHAVLKNDSGKKIVRLLSAEQKEVDPSLYRITQGGRVLEFSNQLLMLNCTRDKVMFYVILEDETWVDVYITNEVPLTE